MQSKNQTSVVAGLLGNRPFMSLWVGQILSQVASNIALFLLALVVYSVTGSNTAVSGIFLAYGIPSVLFGMLAGAVVDRLDKRAIIIWSGILRAILVVGLPFVTHDIGIVYFLLFLNAVVSQFYTPAEAPMIPKLVTPEQLVVANSMFSFAFYSSMAIGFIAAGPFLRYFGQFWSFVVLVLFFLLSSIFATILPKDEKPSNIRRFFRYDSIVVVKKVWRSMLDGITYVRSSRRLSDSLVLLTATQIIFALLGTLGPGFADRVMHIDIRDASLYIIGPVIAGVLLGSVWIGNIGYRFRSNKLISTGILSAGAVLVLVSLTVYLKRFDGFGWMFTDSVIVPLELLLFFLLGFANSLLDAPANAQLQKAAEGEMRGRVYGLLSAAVGGVGIIPVLIGGILADTLGVGKVILILGCAIVIYGIIRLRYTYSD